MTDDQLNDIEETLSDALSEVYDADEGLAILADYMDKADTPHAEFAGRLHQRVCKVMTAVQEAHEAIEEEKFSRRDA